MEKLDQTPELKEKYPGHKRMFLVLADKFGLNTESTSEDNNEMSIKLIKAFKDASTGNADELKRLYDEYGRGLEKKKPEITTVGAYDDKGRKKEDEKPPSKITDIRI
ncbi:MAG: hypothetical protein QMD77_04025 [Patescibacteria group bacterium]|nr:hypothetical protein [Patescibacteria group bacterium]